MTAASPEIEAVDPKSHAQAIWQDDDLRLRLAAADLLAACELVVQRLTLSDCEGEEQKLIAVLKAAIAKAAPLP